jgi:hypothetical protein
MSKQQETPIVEQVRTAREAYASEHNFDLAAMLADLQRKTEEARRAGRKVVSLPPRKPRSRTKAS